MRGVLAIILAALFAATTVQAGQDDQRLTGLFELLRQTKDPVEASATEGIIWRIWAQSGRDDVDGEMASGVRAMSAGELQAALGFFNHVVELAPNLAEGWNTRATIYYLLEDYDSSVRDVERALALEPRHFGALSGLGLICIALGEDARAIKAIEGALAVHPHLLSMRDALEFLKNKTKGRPI